MSGEHIFSMVNLAREVVDDTNTDSRLWIDLTDDVRQRPLLFDCTNGAWANLLSIRPGGQLKCHYHTGPVHAFTLKGSWRYLEHDWVAGEGTFVYEPPGEVHTLVVDEPVEEMITMFNVNGAMIYVDEKGATVGYEDVFTKIEMCRAHYEKVGLGADFVTQFVR